MLTRQTFAVNADTNFLASKHLRSIPTQISPRQNIWRQCRHKFPPVKTFSIGWILLHPYSILYTIQYTVVFNVQNVHEHHQNAYKKSPWNLCYNLECSPSYVQIIYIIEFNYEYCSKAIYSYNQCVLCSDKNSFYENRLVQRW